MSVEDAIVGKPLSSSEESKEQLSVFTGVPVLGLDALASTGYGPEAALTILVPLGTLGLRYFPFIAIAVLVLLTMLYLSYQQTAAAYPNGGGAYVVAHDNLGTQPAVWAAAALLIDYLLNVAVGIAAGAGAVVSALPALQPYTLALCLIVLLTLTLVNLRGVRESGVAFIAPLSVFVGCMAVAIAMGLVHALLAGGNPHPVIAPPPLPRASGTISTWLLLAAFANGCTAMTGIEAVSNGVPLFREPKVPNARRTLTVIYAVLGIFLLALGYLCPAYRIGAMDEQKPGYQTVLSQLIAAVTGRGPFYFVAIASIFIVLTYSAQTSFADFPRVCRLLAEDRFLPPFFATRGRRLVFSYGIVALAVLSGLLLIAFGGVTEKLIPLFAIGAFTAFVMSQTGMVVHWFRRPGPGVRIKLVCNAVGAATTCIALAIIILAKFTEGAWITIVVVPGLVILLNRIRNHYRKVAKEVEPLGLQPSKLQPPIVIIPIDTWNRATEKAMRLGLLLSDRVIALHVATEHDDKERQRKLWEENVEKPAQAAGIPVPRLEVIDSPYRFVQQPIVQFLEKIKRDEPDRLIAVVIPELVEPHWSEYLLYNVHGRKLRALIRRKRDERTVVIDAPWYLHDR